MSSRKIVDRAAIGEPPKKLQKKTETIQLVVYDFADRKEKRGEFIRSPALTAHGYKWNLRIYPRGTTQSAADEEYVSTYLDLDRGQNDVTAKFSIRCKSKRRKFYNELYKFCSNHPSWGWWDFLKRELALANYLEEDGSLVIEADIQIADEDKRVWYPKELQKNDLLVDLYQDASSETSDVSFVVEGTVFQAHKNVLQLRAKNLYEIAKECGDDAPIPMQSIRKEIFKSVLDFVYSVKVPEIQNKETAIEYLVAADRYDCIHLKLFAESTLVDKFLTPEGAIEMLLLADSHTCALLKEAAMNLFVTDGDTLRNSAAWSNIKESNKLKDEVLDHVLNSTKAVANESDYSQMDVSTLRTELQEANLDLDGSRAMLVERLKTYREGSQE